MGWTLSHLPSGLALIADAISNEHLRLTRESVGLERGGNSYIQRGLLMLEVARALRAKKAMSRGPILFLPDRADNRPRRRAESGPLCA